MKKKSVGFFGSGGVFSNVAEKSQIFSLAYSALAHFTCFLIATDLPVPFRYVQGHWQRCQVFDTGFWQVLTVMSKIDFYSDSCQQSCDYPLAYDSDATKKKLQDRGNCYSVVYCSGASPTSLSKPILTRSSV